MGLKVVTTIRKPNGYEYNVAMDESNLRGWLRNAADVLMEGETLSFKRQLPGYNEVYNEKGVLVSLDFSTNRKELGDG